MNEQYDILTNIVLVLISTFGPALAATCIVYLRQAHLRAQKEHWYALVREFAETAVTSAEQLGLSGQIKDIGTEKYRHAIDHLEGALAANGIKVDLDVPAAYLRDIIEAEVNRLPKMPVAEIKE